MSSNSQIEMICSDIRKLLDQAVRRCITDNKIAILLSGGLDTSIVAAISSNYASPSAYTVALKGAPAPDIEYSSTIARLYSLDHRIHYIDEDEVRRLIPIVVGILRTFDPMEVRNSLAIYSAMCLAKEDDVEVVLTGDGSDELMAGYSFFFSMKKERLDAELQKLWRAMSFSGVKLAESLGMAAKNPFLDEDFKDFAMSIDSKYKIGTEGDQIYGKWILRKAYEAILPKEITWRTKTPIEYGSGTTILPQYFDSKVSDGEFNEKKALYKARDSVTIRDKEQLVYYEAFRSVAGPLRQKDHGRACPQCGSEVADQTSFCRTCGAYPI